MTTKTLRRSAAPQANGALPPYEAMPDPPPDPDMKQHLHQVRTTSMLRGRFPQREGALVAGEGYLCHNRKRIGGWLVPDCVVAFGVDPDAIYANNGYEIDVVGKPPDFVLEVASKHTGVNDYTVKRDGYAGYGVREYWRFDPTGGEYHDVPLAGDVLVGGAYEPIAISREPGGLLRGYSAALDLELHWDNGELQLYDPAAREYLPDYEELSDALADTKDALANTEDALANTTNALTNTTNALADTKDALARSEAEAARLREKLRRLRP